MSLILSILVWTLLAVLLVFMLALATPLRLEMEVQKDSEWRYSAALRPFGRFGPRMAMSGRKKKPEAAEKERKKPPARRRRWRVRPQTLVGAIVRLIQDILSHVRISLVDIDARFGLGDPAETGQVYGAFCPVIYGTSHVRDTQFHLEPVFDRAVLVGRAKLVLSLIPATLLIPLARFGWHAFRPVR